MMTTLTQNERYLKLIRILQSHVDIRNLFFKINELIDTTQTLREAMIRLRHDLAISCVIYTGRDKDQYAPDATSLALAEFHRFLDRFENRKEVENGILISADDIETLRDLLIVLHKNEHLYV